MTNKIRTELSGFASISFTTEYKTGGLRSALQKHADTLREWAKVNTGGVWVDAEPMAEKFDSNKDGSFYYPHQVFLVDCALKGIEALGALLGKTKHPLEEVFAKVETTGPAFNHSCEFIDRAFRDYVERGQETTNQEARLRRAVWWASVRLIKQSRYQTIEDVLAAAVLQATKGKGQRHGGDITPFLEQPWAKLYRTHGLGFLLGQADKKYHEALGKPDAESFEREILGAIVYLGMALLALEGRV